MPGKTEGPAPRNANSVTGRPHRRGRWLAPRHLRSSSVVRGAGFAEPEGRAPERRGLVAGDTAEASAKLARMTEGSRSSCTAAKACAVRSHDQGAWVWR